MPLRLDWSAAYELAEVALEVVKSSLGATEDGIATSVARMLRFKATGTQLTKLISAVLPIWLLQGPEGTRTVCW